MRILHVIPHFPYFGGRTVVGGHASSLLSLTLAQHRLGEEVTILTYSPGRIGSFLVDDALNAYSLFREKKTRTILFGLRFCRAATQWLARRRADFDVVHVHSGFSEYFLLSSRLKEKTGLPVLHTIYCPIAPRGRARLPGLRFAIMRWATQVNAICGISENVVSSLSQYGIKNVECVRPALDLERFRPGSREYELRRALGLQQDDVVILFVGNATPEKNLERVLLAIHSLVADFPKIRLVITTELKHSTSDAALLRLRELIEALGLSDHIIKQGVVDNMPGLMRACDVLVAPFLNTYGPSDYFMAALEAMAVSRPVVVSGVGGMREIMSQQVGELVDPGDPLAIAAGLRAYCADSELRTQVGGSARSFVEANFAPQDIARRYDSLYRALVP